MMSRDRISLIVSYIYLDLLLLLHCGSGHILLLTSVEFRLYLLSLFLWLALNSFMFTFESHLQFWVSLSLSSLTFAFVLQIKTKEGTSETFLCGLLTCLACSFSFCFSSCLLFGTLSWSSPRPGKLGMFPGACGPLPRPIKNVTIAKN